MDFQEFPKMARLSREVIVTEKIDGTNAQIFIYQTPAFDESPLVLAQDGNGLAMLAGSRTRWITPADDNYGFASWAQANAEELFKLGVGRHFGEWWGAGIQRRYGMSEKVFSLFNVSRWGDDAARPACCRTVPVLYHGIFTDIYAHVALSDLERDGSRAAPGFMKPEGIVLYHVAAGIGFKKTIEKDEMPKSLVQKAA